MKKIQVEHELDKLFNVKPGQTEVMVPGPPDSAQLTELTEFVAPDMPGSETYDQKDEEIEVELAEIKTRAIEAYETMILASQTVVDKKYASSNAEVAANFLNIALNAVKEKNSTKDRKDKIAAKKQGAKAAPLAVPQQISTTNIVTDRETALKLMKEHRDGTQE